MAFGFKFLAHKRPQAAKNVLVVSPVNRTRIIDFIKCFEHLASGLFGIHGTMLPFMQISGKIIFFSFSGLVNRAERSEKKREYRPRKIALVLEIIMGFNKIPIIAFTINPSVRDRNVPQI